MNVNLLQIDVFGKNIDWVLLEALPSSYPPCIRAICTDSKQTGLVGTLCIVPYTGGTVGNDPKTSAIYVPPNELNMQLNAEIFYNLDKKSYFIRSEWENIVGFRFFIDDNIFVFQHKTTLKIPIFCF